MSDLFPIVLKPWIDVNIDHQRFLDPGFVGIKTRDLGLAMTHFPDLAKFCFGKVVGWRFPDRPPYRAIYDVQVSFEASLPSGRSASPNEEDLCTVLHELICNCQSRDAIDKMRSLLLEWYYYQTSTRIRDALVVHSASIEVNGDELVDGGHRSIDVGVDKMDQAQTLVLAECASNLRIFENAKLGQLAFYVYAMSKVREIEDRSFKQNFTLIVELIVAHGETLYRGERPTISIPLEMRRAIQEHRIRVIGKSVAEEIEWVIIPN